MGAGEGQQVNRCQGLEVCVMQRAEQVLDSLEQQAMRPHFKFDRLYRNLFNADFYRYAGHAMAVESPAVHAIIDAMRCERYRPSSTANEHSLEDRLVARTVSVILRALLGPARPARSALESIAAQWPCIKYAIVGQPQDHAGSLYGALVVESLRQRIVDGRFRRLMQALLQSGLELPPLYNYWVADVDGIYQRHAGSVVYVRSGGRFLFGISTDSHARISVPDIVGFEVNEYRLSEGQSVRFLDCDVDGSPRLGIPSEILRDEIRQFSRHGRPAPRSEWVHLSESEIITRYFARLREFIDYYRFVPGLKRRVRKLRFYALTSLSMTLAQKLRMTRRQAYERFSLRERWRDELAKLEMIN